MSVPVVRKDAKNILRKIRKDNGLTIVELAHLMNLGSSAALSNIEYGTNNFTLEKAFLAADALNVSVNVFLQ
ncbi:helix-turn-helix transcriptional regulator [Lactiplantibacillus paraxiangfangensis]|uniref:helix-turn-helix domain-containing protein n=1 Tax=Lactiplantibacillus paraxiangfangensis TaxID=3076224 RepID=UPI0030C7313E